MKKFLTYLCVICVTFALFFVLFKKTDVLPNIISNFEILVSSVKSQDVEEYNSDFSVNSLGKIKYNTYYYDKLNAEQQKIYTGIANSVKNLDETAMIKIDKDYDFAQISEDAKKAMEAFFADHPEVFYLNTEYQILTNSSLIGNSLKLYFGYSVSSKDELEQQICTIESGIKEFTSDISDLDTEYDKELKIHDSIASKVTYYSYNDITNIPEVYHTAYSAIKEKSSVCDGFTKIYQLALNQVGIPSILVTGTLESDPHAWNMVELEDGWYNVDLTSDKTIKENNNAVVHTYFNVTNDYIKQSHEFYDEANIPTANSEQFNYYSKESKYIKSSDNFNTKFENILKNNKNSVLIEFKADEKISQVPEKIVKRLSQRDYKEYIDLNTNTIQYYTVLNTYIIVKN